ncbi:para-aminobenzoate synthetase component 1 [Streptoalloteichus tenebrarius]|uniref:Para-aminobenzoate synthetase component 1 n=1 Tax=Streptoalloteichus tenebrarius (strain ATCC 17920 / DSM 40477 / JCM 4838 / CBS 697.72 / NBRC 16177 / NCIMB 11028 / NRRL B-12390 / A12253. 1 / ISP 5477) TaxID=1933 RepID=A0ABT1I415_STRSD|nr:para-aminobenzoate synthetase component 1 [Streptoalloteichus tenebrarius]
MEAVWVVSRPLVGDAGPERVLRRLAARASAAGLAPPAAVTGDWFGGQAVLAPTVRVEPVSRDRAFTALDRQPAVVGGSDLPPGVVGGGWFGYLGYGLTDPGRWPAPDGGSARRLPDAAWGWADHVLRRDRRGRWWFEALVPVGSPAPEDLVEELGALVAAAEDPPVRPWTAGPTRRRPAERHEAAVAGCVERIAAGEIFQANVCTRFEWEFDGDPLEVFAAGSARLGPARAAYLAGGWGAVASLSPELFLARRDRVVRSSPIKGTLPRRGPANAGNAALLRRSAKDVAENVMIVDLVRNDLGRVCEVGSVTVPELLEVRPHPGVWHLVSTVEGRLPSAAPHADLLAATFPPGSVTGAPKLRALEVVAELETTPREVYCGAVGVVSPLAGLELNVAIRTLEHQGDRLWLGVGGGVTADSDPHAEWRECLTKAAPLEALLCPADWTAAPGVGAGAASSGAV